MTNSSMVSSPATSSSSQDGNEHAIKRRKWKSSPSKLPSPQRSDSDPHSDPSETHHHHDGDGDGDYDDDVNADETVSQANDAILTSYSRQTAEHARPTFHLKDQHTYERLYQGLRNAGLLDHYEQNIRKHWNSETGRLTLQLMPGTLHEIFKENLGRALSQELDRIAEANPNLRPFCSRTISAGHAQITKRAKGANAPHFDRSPDGQLQYVGQRYPHVIIEIAYSQDKKSLENTAREYFEKVPDNSCTLLAFDIDYAYPQERRKPGHKHPASVSVWTSEPSPKDPETIDINNLMDALVFRDKNGTATPGEIVLPFRLLVPVGERNNIPDTDAEARLPFACLAEFIDEGEQQQRVSEASVTPEPAAPPPRKLRWLDKDGKVTREVEVNAPKRKPRTSSASESAPLSVRTTRLASQPRRSRRLRSMSKDGTQ